ncbi:MAG TPA: hypothetical protein VHI52_01380 [Verrucomicrobiae bacterium]|nr:hypothetical protein [Verrucomicrobiae bacterium]
MGYSDSSFPMSWSSFTSTSLTWGGRFRLNTGTSTLSSYRGCYKPWSSCPDAFFDTGDTTLVGINGKSVYVILAFFPNGLFGGDTFCGYAVSFYGNSAGGISLTPFAVYERAGSGAPDGTYIGTTLPAGAGWPSSIVIALDTVCTETTTGPAMQPALGQSSTISCTNSAQSVIVKMANAGPPVFDNHCSWVSLGTSDSWLTASFSPLTSGMGGDDQAILTMTANTTGATRTATFSVQTLCDTTLVPGAILTFTINQAG